MADTPAPATPTGGGVKERLAMLQAQMQSSGGTPPAPAPAGRVGAVARNFGSFNSGGAGGGTSDPARPATPTGAGRGAGRGSGVGTPTGGGEQGGQQQQPQQPQQAQPTQQQQQAQQQPQQQQQQPPQQHQPQQPQQAQPQLNVPGAGGLVERRANTFTASGPMITSPRTLKEWPPSSASGSPAAGSAIGLVGGAGRGEWPPGGAGRGGAVGSPAGGGAAAGGSPLSPRGRGAGDWIGRPLFGSSITASPTGGASPEGGAAVGTGPSPRKLWQAPGGSPMATTAMSPRAVGALSPTGRGAWGGGAPWATGGAAGGPGAGGLNVPGGGADPAVGRLSPHQLQQQQQQQQQHPPAPQSSKAQFGHLIVFIFEGMELMAKEGSGKGNPYVVAYIDEDAFAEAEEKAATPVPAVAPASGTGDGAAKTDEAEDKKRTDKDEKKSKNRPLRTRVIERTQSPKWREEFYFPVRNRKMKLVFQVGVAGEVQDDKKKDENKGDKDRKKEKKERARREKLNEENEVLGTATVDLETLTDNDKVDLILPIENFQSGKLHVQISFLGLQSPPARSMRAKKLDPFHIWLERDLFYPGSTMRGHLFLNPTKRYKVAEVKLNCEITETNKWEKTVGGEVIEYKKSIEVCAKEFICDRDVLNGPSREGVVKLEPGSYMWPFTFDITKKLPPGRLHFSPYSVTCCVVATIYGQTHEKLLRAEKDFDVCIPTEVFPTFFPTLQEKGRRYRGKHEEQDVTASVEVDKPFYLPGDRIQATLRIKNDSKYRVNKINSALFQECGYEAQKFSKGKIRSKEKSDKITQVTTKSIGIKPGERYKEEILLPLPAKMVPTISTEMSLICKLEYKLDVEITVGADSKVLLVTVPIIITTAKVEGLPIEWEPKPRQQDDGRRKKSTEGGRRDEKKEDKKKKDGDKEDRA